MGHKAPSWKRRLRRQSSRDYYDRLRGYLATGNTEALDHEQQQAAELGQRIAAAGGEMNDGT